MYRVKLFTLPTCPKCPAARALAAVLSEKHGLDVETYDMSTPEGLGEGASYGVMSTPSFLVVRDPDGDDEIVREWMSSVPSPAEVVSAASGS